MNKTTNTKSLAVFDVDNTIINGQSQYAFIRFLRKKRIISSFSYARIVFWFLLYKSGFVQDPQKIMSYAFLLLKGRGTEEIRLLVDEFVEKELRGLFFTGALEKIEEERERGCRIILLSNAADFLVSAIAKCVQADDFISTRLEIFGGKYTGLISGMIIYDVNKLRSLNVYAVQNGYNLDSISAYADHDSDILLLSAVANAHVVNPSNSLRRIAINNHWSILKFS